MTENLPLGGGVGAVPARKKFATPPVKIACLACRSSRTRCNGGHPCANCESRSRECVYKPSRRGGARVRRKRASEPLEAGGTKTESLELALNEMPQAPQEPIPLPTFVDAGAGLAQLPDWPLDSDFIFDSLFSSYGPPKDAATSGNSSLNFAVDPLTQSEPTVRTYKSNDAILDAYYIFIHPYFPILPPPSKIPLDQPVPKAQHNLEDFDRQWEPSSPIGLAIAAILALIPCPDDANYLLPDSVVFRRKYAHYLAQAAMEAIESESEIPDSSIDPSRALESEDQPSRQPLHAQVPVELETIIALNLLSVYEYTQRGNLKKMQSRAGQAMASAMALGLQNESSEDEFSEARRRVWWMTYVTASSTAIVCNTKSSLEPFQHKFTTKLPLIQADPEAFGILVQAQDALEVASHFSIDLKKAIVGGFDMTPLFQRMIDLERIIEPMEAQSESWILSSTTTSPVDPTEAVLSRSLRCMAQIRLTSARIRVHRYCAFSDRPIFFGRHCDLKPLEATNSNSPQEPQQWPSCSCTTPDHSDHTNHLSRSNNSSPDISQFGLATPNDTISENGSASDQTAFPFTSHHSARVCLKSALNITNAYENLPYPNPTGQTYSGLGCYLSPTSAIVAPRTMPNFACCAMQCAYALLMVHQKTATMFADQGNGILVGSLLAMLQGGLTSILGTIENYGTAFEALGGMRDQIRVAIATHVTPAPPFS